ncbi:MAG: exosortase-dependent surface protein XDP2 [Leptolyngbyaceae cyanobacterium]
MTFSFSQLSMATGLATGTLLSVFGAGNAFAIGFDFETTFSQNDAPTGDILLESVTIGDEIIEEFSFVTAAVINQNGGEINGGASADKGDTATTGVAVEDAAAADIVTNLSNNNLNNIVDTEKQGFFEIDLTFGKVIDNLLIWERGGTGETYGNSDLKIQALDAAGQLVGNSLTITRDMWFDAGFQIDTTEISAAQNVGSLGINIFEDLGVDNAVVDAIRFTSEEEFNGPDWKFVGTDATRVPEPTVFMGLGLLGGALFLQKRVKAA